MRPIVHALTALAIIALLTACGNVGRQRTAVEHTIRFATPTESTTHTIAEPGHPPIVQTVQLYHDDTPRVSFDGRHHWTEPTTYCVTYHDDVCVDFTWRPAVYRAPSVGLTAAP